MPLLTSSLFLSFLFGFAFPPFWIITFLCARSIIRIGRMNHAMKHYAAEQARMKLYLGWSK